VRGLEGKRTSNEEPWNTLEKTHAAGHVDRGHFSRLGMSGRSRQAKKFRRSRPMIGGYEQRATASKADRPLATGNIDAALEIMVLSCRKSKEPAR
jgi:hypothetical protein